MSVQELERLRDFISGNKVEGAYGLMVKKNGDAALELTHYIFPKFLPHVAKGMGAAEIGSHPLYLQLLENARAAGLEFDTADAHGSFTGLARRVQSIPISVSEGQFGEIKKLKGFGALLKLLEMIAGMEKGGERSYLR